MGSGVNPIPYSLFPIPYHLLYSSHFINGLAQRLVLASSRYYPSRVVRVYID